MERDRSPAERYSLIRRDLTKVLGEDRLKSVLESRDAVVYWETAPARRESPLVHHGVVADEDVGLATLESFGALTKIFDLLNAGVHVKVLLDSEFHNLAHSARRLTRPPRRSRIVRFGRQDGPQHRPPSRPLSTHPHRPPPFPRSPPRSNHLRPRILLPALPLLQPRPLQIGSHDDRTRFQRRLPRSRRSRRS